MLPRARRALRRLHPFLLLVLAVLALGGVSAWAAAGGDERVFDLPADSAERSLKRFSEQSGREVLFASQVTRGVRAKAVKGALTPAEAMQGLLADTGLVAVHDPVTGAFSVRRETAEESRARGARVSSAGIPEAGDAQKKKDSDRQPPNHEPMKKASFIARLGMTLGLLAAPAAHAADATGIVTGRVYNEATQEYLRNATVAVEGTNLAVQTASGGEYTLFNVPAGAVRVVATYADLQRAVAEVSVGGGQRLSQDLALKPPTDRMQDGTIVMQQFLVTGEREGAAKALVDQRESIDFKQVLASDTFGSVSEGNVAEFVKYLPGVMVDFVENDARSISIGGLGPEYVSVLQDGAPIASAGPGGAMSAGRGFQFDQQAISAIESIELSRTPTPDVAASSMAGVLNLRSKGAFDRRGRQTRWDVYLRMNSEHMLRKTPGPELTDTHKVHPSFSLTHSDIFMDGRLGVLVNASRLKSFDNQKWQFTGFSFNGNPGDNETEIPRMTEILLLDSPLTQVRSNAMVRLDFKASPDFTLWASGSYSRYEMRTFSRNFVARFPSAITNDPNVEYSLYSQTSANGSAQYTLQGSAQYRHGFNGTYNLGASFKRNHLSVDGLIQYSLSKNATEDLPHGFFRNGNTEQLTGLRLRWERKDLEAPDINVFQLAGPDFRDLSNFRAPANPMQTNITSREAKWTYKADFRYTNPGWNLPLSLRWGANVLEHYKKTGGDINNAAYTYLGPDLVANSGDESWQNFIEPHYRLSMPWRTNLNGLHALDRFAMAKEYYDHPERFLPPSEATYLNGFYSRRRQFYERVDAVYFWPLFRVTNKFDLSPGVRWERTDWWGRARKDIGDAQAREILTGSRTGSVNTGSADYVNTRYGTLNTRGGTYNDTFKYLHLTYRGLENWVVRLSYNDAITRPPLAQLVGDVSISNIDVIPPRASVPNNDLRPEMSRSLQLNIERYFAAGGGYVSVTGARRDMKDLIRSTTELIPIDGDFRGDPEWAGWELTTTDNIAKGHVSSLIFDYRQRLRMLPGLLGKLTVNGNYTRMFYDDYENFRRPSQLANGGLSFTHRGFTTSWLLNYVPRHRTNEVPANGWATYRSESLRHALRLNYVGWRGINFYIQGDNIFNAPNRIYFGSGDRFIMNRYSDYGAKWTVGMKGAF